jgi:hypothetical protein
MTHPKKRKQQCYRAEPVVSRNYIVSMTPKKMREQQYGWKSKFPLDSASLRFDDSFKDERTGGMEIFLFLES